MNVSTTVAGIEYGILEASQTSAMTNLLAEAFSRFEPMGVAVGLPFDQVERLVAALAPKALRERLTVIARDRSSGHLVGALLADDFGTPPPVGLEEAAPLFAPVGALLDGLDDQYRRVSLIRPGTHAHLFMVGVSQHATARGIATQLIATCLEQARQLGYRTAVTEATGQASQRAFRKLGFKDLFLASYKEFVFAGEHVFSSIQGAEGTVLMARQITGDQQGGSGGAV